VGLGLLCPCVLAPRRTRSNCAAPHASFPDVINAARLAFLPRLLPLFGRDAAPLFVLAMDSDLPLALDSESPLAVASLSPDSMVIAPESVAPDLLVELQDSVPPESEVAPKDDSSPLDSEMVPESLEFVPDSMAPESEHALPPGAFVCARCHLVHEDRQAWDRAHSRFWPCSRCGLMHLEYMLLAMLYCLDEFDCKVFIPDLDKVVMHGNNIKFDPQVLKMLDEKCERELAARKDDGTATVR